MEYYQINEQAARRAREANSYSDYVPGSATAEYRAMVDHAAEIAEAQKERVDPIHHDKIDHLLDKYARKLADNLNNGFAIDARVPSILVAGPANFPVRQKEKQNMARDKNMGEYMHIKGLLDKIQSTGTGLDKDTTTRARAIKVKIAYHSWYATCVRHHAGGTGERTRTSTS